MQERKPVFDIVKFVIMCFVVAGHISGNELTEFDRASVSYLSNFNVGVAMPLFFMISGYFAVSTLNGKWSKIMARIIGFLWPLASFGAVFGIALLLLGKAPLWKVAAYPFVRLIGGSWFLATLAVVYTISAIVFHAFHSVRMRILAFFVVYVLCFFFAGGRDVVSRTLRIGNVLDMLPYFVFGAMCLKPLDLYRKWWIALPCGIFFLAVVLFEGNIRENGMGFYWVSKDWRMVLSDGHLFLCFWGRTLVGLTGGVFVLWSIGRVLDVIHRLDCLAVFGTTTLGVYVMHEWPLIQIHKYCSFEPLPSWSRWPLALALFLVCHFLTVWIRRNSKLNFIFFGDVKWLSGKVEGALCRLRKNRCFR